MTDTAVSKTFEKSEILGIMNILWIFELALNSTILGSCSFFLLHLSSSPSSQFCQNLKKKNLSWKISWVYLYDLSLRILIIKTQLIFQLRFFFFRFWQNWLDGDEERWRRKNEQDPKIVEFNASSKIHSIFIIPRISDFSNVFETAVSVIYILFCK